MDRKPPFAVIGSNFAGSNLFGPSSNVRETLRRATEKFLNSEFASAVELYRTALNGGILLHERIVTRYALVLAMLDSARNLADVNQAKAQLDLLSSETKETALKFPLIHLAYSKLFLKLNDKDDAKLCLNAAAVERKEPNFLMLFSWPESNIRIPETESSIAFDNTYNKLVKLYKEIPRTPPFTCRGTDCVKLGYRRHYFYFNDIDFCGFVRLRCVNKCELDFHCECYEALKPKLKINHFSCLDCANLGRKGHAFEIQYYRADSTLKSVENIDIVNLVSKPGFAETESKFSITDLLKVRAPSVNRYDTAIAKERDLAKTNHANADMALRAYSEIALRTPGGSLVPDVKDDLICQPMDLVASGSEYSFTYEEGLNDSQNLVFSDSGSTSLGQGHVYPSVSQVERAMKDFAKVKRIQELRLPPQNMETHDLQVTVESAVGFPLSEPELYVYFDVNFGSPPEMVQMSTVWGCYFVRFSQRSPEESVLAKQVHFISGHVCRVVYASAARMNKLYVRGITPSITTQKLTEFFSEFGEVREASLYLKTGTCGFVSYDSIDDAQRLIGEKFQLADTIIYVKQFVQPKKASVPDVSGPGLGLRLVPLNVPKPVSPPVGLEFNGSMNGGGFVDFVSSNVINCRRKSRWDISDQQNYSTFHCDNFQQHQQHEFAPLTIASQQPVTPTHDHTPRRTPLLPLTPKVLPPPGLISFDLAATPQSLKVPGCVSFDSAATCMTQITKVNASATTENTAMSSATAANVATIPIPYLHGHHDIEPLCQYRDSTKNTGNNCVCSGPEVVVHTCQQGGGNGVEDFASGYDLGGYSTHNQQYPADTQGGILPLMMVPGHPLLARSVRNNHKRQLLTYGNGNKRQFLTAGSSNKRQQLYMDGIQLDEHPLYATHSFNDNGLTAADFPVTQNGKLPSLMSLEMPGEFVDAVAYPPPPPPDSTEGLSRSFPSSLVAGGVWSPAQKKGSQETTNDDQKHVATGVEKGEPVLMKTGSKKSGNLSKQQYSKDPYSYRKRHSVDPGPSSKSNSNSSGNAKIGFRSLSLDASSSMVSKSSMDWNSGTVSSSDRSGTGHSNRDRFGTGEKTSRSTSSSLQHHNAKERYSAKCKM